MRRWKHSTLVRVVTRWKGFMDASVALAHAAELQSVQDQQMALGKAMAEEAALESSKNK